MVREMDVKLASKLLSKCRVSDSALNQTVFSAVSLLERAAEYLGDNPPDTDWFRDYYLLTGDHVILTDEGWEPASCKEQLLTDGGEVYEELNG